MSFPPEGTKPLFFSWEKGATRVLVAKRKICVKSDIKIKVPEASATTISERLQGGREKAWTLQSVPPGGWFSTAFYEAISPLSWSL